MVDDQRRHIIAIEPREVDLIGNGGLTGSLGDQDAAALQAGQTGNGAGWVARLAEGSTGPIGEVAGTETRIVDEAAGIGFRSSGAEARSEEHTSELQSRENLVCRHLLEKKHHRK